MTQKTRTHSRERRSKNRRSEQERRQQKPSENQAASPVIVVPKIGNGNLTRLHDFCNEVKPFLFPAMRLANGTVAKRGFIDPSAAYRGLLETGCAEIVVADLLFYQLLDGGMEPYIDTCGFKPIRKQATWHGKRGNPSIERVYRAHGTSSLIRHDIADITPLLEMLTILRPGFRDYTPRRSLALESCVATMQVIEDFGWDDPPPVLYYFRQSNPPLRSVGEQVMRGDAKARRRTARSLLVDSVGVGSEEPDVRLRECDRRYKPHIFVEILLRNGGYVRLAYLDFVDSFLDMLEVNGSVEIHRADVFIYYLIGMEPMNMYTPTHGFERPLFRAKGKPRKPLSPSVARVYNERTQANGCCNLTYLSLPEMIDVQKAVNALVREPSGFLFRQSFTLALILAVMRVAHRFGFTPRLVAFWEELGEARQSTYGFAHYIEG